MNIDEIPSKMVGKALKSLEKPEISHAQQLRQVSTARFSAPQSGLDSAAVDLVLAAHDEGSLGQLEAHLHAQELGLKGFSQPCDEQALTLEPVYIYSSKYEQHLVC